MHTGINLSTDGVDDCVLEHDERLPVAPASWRSWREQGSRSLRPGAVISAEQSSCCQKRARLGGRHIFCSWGTRARVRRTVGRRGEAERHGAFSPALQARRKIRAVLMSVCLREFVTESIRRPETKRKKKGNKRHLINARPPVLQRRKVKFVIRCLNGGRLV